MTPLPLRGASSLLLLAVVAFPLAWLGHENLIAKPRGARNDVPSDFAIASFLNGNFELIDPNGHTHTFDLRSVGYFVACQFSANGKFLAGATTEDLVVLGQDLRAF